MDDFELEDELREIANLLDPIPAQLLDDAMQAFTLRTLDAELAELTFDSWEQEPATRVRGGGPRLLTFEAGGVAVEVEVANGRLVGRLLPGGPAEVGVQRRDGEVRLLCDDLGRFAAEGLSRGPVRLRVAREGRGTVVTSWTLI
jgi:hypothetical protein